MHSPVNDSHVARAVDRVRRLDTIGLRDRLPESLRLVFRHSPPAPAASCCSNEIDRVAMKMQGSSNDASKAADV